MKSSTRRQVKTPVGHKTKRGAELEGTPKTPRSVEASPAKSVCSLEAEPDDRKLPLRTKRPLQWGNIPKQRIDIDTRGENTMSPSKQAQMKCNGDPKPVAALSPICVNAINGNTAQHGAEHKVCLKNSKELASAVKSPSVKASPDRRCLGKAEALQWSTQQRDETGEVSADEGSCLSSPHISPSGKQVLFWSNAAFSTHEPGQNEFVSLIKKTPGSSSCASSASTSQSAGSIALADAEVESIRLESMNVCSRFTKQLQGETQSMLHSGDAAEHDEDPLQVDLQPIQKEIQPPETTGRAGVSETANALGHGQMPSSSKLNAAEAEDGKKEHSGACKNDLFDLVVSTPGVTSSQMLKPGTGCYTGLPQFGSPSMKQNQEKTKCSWEPGNDEESLKDGLHRIQQEIERLTERLAELHLQKRKREEEIQRQTKARKKNLIGSLATAEESSVAMEVEKARETKRRAGAGAYPKTMEGDGGSCRNPIVRQSPKAQRTCGTASRSRDEAPQASSGRPAKVSAAVSASKLSEMRRSASCAGRRAERNSSEERMKALRRLSLSGAATAESKAQQAQLQGMAKLTMLGKGTPTPSRVVSSRYGRAMTPDACRPCAPAGNTPSQKRDRDRPAPSTSACSSPLPAQPQPTPLSSASIHCSPLKGAPTPSSSASIHCSPLKGAPTVRSGYPSRSGFSTPSKDRKPLIKPPSFLSSSVQLPLSTSFLSSSVQLPLSKLSSPLAKTPDRKCLLLSSPRCTSPLPRFDSPKSTAALYKCLESLLEDSKHFFKRLSPVRPRRLPHLTENSIAGAGAASPKQLLPVVESTLLPAINTCRSEAISPRDSGCVKRASDRLKRHFYFAEEDGNCPPLEATVSAAGIKAT